MKSILTAIVALLSINTYSAVKLQCDLAFNQGVYSQFTLEFKGMESEYGLPYSLKEIENTEVVLDGIANVNHEDNDDIGEDWSFVTLGPRTATIKEDTYDNEGLGFNIESCKDCDFNGATYQYRKTNEDEVYITEMYGSDGSGAFAIYSCFKL